MISEELVEDAARVVPNAYVLHYTLVDSTMYSNAMYVLRQSSLILITILSYLFRPLSIHRCRDILA